MMKGIAGKFIKSRLFSVLFVCLTVVLIDCMAVRLESIIEASSMINVYAVFFMLLCIYLGYMFSCESSSRIRKATHKLYASCGVLLCFSVVDGIGIVLYKPYFFL